MRSLAFSCLLIALLPTVAHAQGAAGPSTSGGSLPYLMNSPSEDEVARRRKARAAEAAAAAEQAKAAEAAAAQAPATTQSAQIPPSAPARAVAEPETPKTIAVQPVTDSPAVVTTDPAKPKSVATKPKVVPGAVLPPGITSDGRAGPLNGPATAPDRNIRPRDSAVAELGPQQPPVVYRPLFFGIFGPPVATTPDYAPPPPPPANTGSNGRLRPFEPGSAGTIARQGGRPLPSTNCHYHTNAMDGLQPHRDIRCHWHQDPYNPSLRYVQ